MVGGQPARHTLVVGQPGRQAEELQRRRSQSKQRVGVAAPGIQPRRAQARLGQRPLHQSRQGPGGDVEDQTTGAVRGHLPGRVCVDDGERPVHEPRIHRRGPLGSRSRTTTPGGRARSGTLRRRFRARYARPRRGRGGAWTSCRHHTGRSGRGGGGRRGRPLLDGRGGGRRGRPLLDGNGGSGGGGVLLRPALQQRQIGPPAGRTRLGTSRLPVLHRLRSRLQNTRERGLRDTGRLTQPRPFSRLRERRPSGQQLLHSPEQGLLLRIPLHASPPGGPYQF